MRHNGVSCVMCYLHGFGDTINPLDAIRGVLASFVVSHISTALYVSSHTPAKDRWCLVFSGKLGVGWDISTHPSYNEFSLCCTALHCTTLHYTTHNETAKQQNTPYISQHYALPLYDDNGLVICEGVIYMRLC